VVSVAQGGGWPPHFLAKGVAPGRSGVDEPPQSQKAKKQNKTLGLWGVAEPPPKALSHPQIGRMGLLKPPPKPTRVDDPPQIGQGGGRATPQTPNVVFLFFWPFGGGRTTSKADWGGSGGRSPPWATSATLFFF
jgi:hypothetical protein